MGTLLEAAYTFSAQDDNDNLANSANLDCLESFSLAPMDQLSDSNQSAQPEQLVAQLHVISPAIITSQLTFEYVSSADRSQPSWRQAPHLQSVGWACTLSARLRLINLSVICRFGCCLLHVPR